MIYEYGVTEALSQKIIKTPVIYQPDIKTVQLTYTDARTGEQRNVEEIDWDKVDRLGLNATQWVTDPKPNATADGHCVGAVARAGTKGKGSVSADFVCGGGVQAGRAEGRADAEQLFQGRDAVGYGGQHRCGTTARYRSGQTKAKRQSLQSGGERADEGEENQEQAGVLMGRDALVLLPWKSRQAPFGHRRRSYPRSATKQSGYSGA